MNTVISFLTNPNYFSGIATAFTGGVAIWIYFSQKSDAKVQIVRLLLMEIRTAEERISQIKDQIENSPGVDFPSVLPSNSWKRYSHLFVSDFDIDELKLLSSFYDYCEVIEEFAKRNNNFFWVTTEEKARVLQQMLGDVIKEGYVKTIPGEASEHIKSKRDFIRAAFDDYGFTYSPQKTVGEMKNYLSKIQPITTSSCGARLKKLAKLR